MKFQEEIKVGKLIKRYKRFFADLYDDENQTITAHVPNTGSMKGLLNENAQCRYSVSTDPKRKLKYTLQMIKTPSSWVGINTHLPNKIAYEAWANKSLSHWKKYNYCQPEFKVSDDTRLDLLMWNKPKDLEVKKLKTEDMKKYKFHFVEIKNVTLCDKPEGTSKQKTALFPDAVTTRGQKHLKHLMQLIEKGHTCELLFLVQRQDCTTFSAAKDIDPEYAELLKKAHKMGLIVSPYACDMKKTGIQLDPSKKLKLSFS